jgi:hypothetical protein
MNSVELVNCAKGLVRATAGAQGVCADSYGSTYRLLRLALSKKKADDFSSLIFVRNNRYYSRVDRDSLIQIIFEDDLCPASTSLTESSRSRKTEKHAV